MALLDPAALVLWHLLQSATLTSPELLAWQQAVVQPVPAAANRHAIHSYFNASPESPDGRFILYYSSAAANGEAGDLRVLNRATGEEKIIVDNLVTEDAHRVACQQWAANGRAVVYHNYDPAGRRWRVLAIDPATGDRRVLAEDRQLGFGSPASDWAPVYGCHWNPGPHRDLQLINVLTGEIQTPLTIGDVLQRYGKEIEPILGRDGLSVFFPVMSPDGKRVFFKLARGNGGDNFRAKGASRREGMVVYDLAARRFLGFFKEWGHPSWTPDSANILQKIGENEGGVFLLDLATGGKTLLVPGAACNHPSMSPTQAPLYVTDANIAWKKGGQPGEWGLFMVSPTAREFTVIHRFPFRNPGLGAQSWRLPDPHPVFSADGKRIYFNANDGPWTRLWVAELGR